VEGLLSSLYLVITYLISNELHFDYTVTVNDKFLSVGIRRSSRRGGPTGQAWNDGKTDFFNLSYYMLQLSCLTCRAAARQVPQRFKFYSVTSRGNFQEIHGRFPAIVAID